MATLTSSLRDLYTFVSTNPRWLPELIENDKTQYCGTPEFWNSFFLYVFGNLVSPKDERAWDELFLRRRMMTAFRILIRVLVRRGRHQLVQIS